MELTGPDSAGKPLTISQAKHQEIIGEINQELVRRNPLILSALHIEP